MGARGGAVALEVLLLLRAAVAAALAAMVAVAIAALACLALASAFFFCLMDFHGSVFATAEQ